MRYRFLSDGPATADFIPVTQAATGGHLVRWTGTGTTPPFYYYAGTTGNDTIDGTALNTPNSGLSQNVTSIYADSGDDFIYAPQDSTINVIGGAGYDIASYEKYTSGIILFIRAVGATDPVAGATAQGNIDVEEVRGTGRSDFIIGDISDNTIREVEAGISSTNILVGGGGNDRIYGNSGNDIITAGGHGNTTVDGGGGTNTLNLANGFDRAGNASGAIIDLFSASTGLATYADGGTVNFTFTRRVNGTQLADVFTGSSGSDLLNGGGGSDVFYATVGNDTIDGGSSQNEVNTLSFEKYNAPVVLNMSSFTDPTQGLLSFGSNSVAFTNIQAFVGTQFNDTIIGGVGNDIFSGGGGSNDIIDGGGGFNTLSFQNVQNGLALNFSSTNSGTIAYGSGNSIRYSNIQEVWGTNFNDVINGSAGNDFFNGGRGNDTILSAGGNDTVQGGGGDDTLDGGAGNDILSFADFTTGITLN
ncbi:MAG TPA: calcium-binding protein, partial [Dongiaceae bacterium]|nr:calcium-binding protein [Dongiaceae bacterium]